MAEISREDWTAEDITVPTSSTAYSRFFFLVQAEVSPPSGSDGQLLWVPAGNEGVQAQYMGAGTIGGAAWPIGFNLPLLVLAGTSFQRVSAGTTLVDLDTDGFGWGDFLSWVPSTGSWAYYKLWVSSTLTQPTYTSGTLRPAQAGTTWRGRILILGEKK